MIHTINILHASKKKTNGVCVWKGGLFFECNFSKGGVNGCDIFFQSFSFFLFPSLGDVLMIHLCTYNTDDQVYI